MELGKKGAIFDWEWGRNSAPRERQMFILYSVQLYWKVCCIIRLALNMTCTSIQGCFFSLFCRKRLTKS